MLPRGHAAVQPIEILDAGHRKFAVGCPYNRFARCDEDFDGFCRRGNNLAGVIRGDPLRVDQVKAVEVALVTDIEDAVGRAPIPHQIRELDGFNRDLLLGNVPLDHRFAALQAYTV